MIPNSIDIDDKRLKDRIVIKYLFIIMMLRSSFARAMRAVSDAKSTRLASLGICRLILSWPQSNSDVSPY